MGATTVTQQPLSEGTGYAVLRGVLDPGALADLQRHALDELTTLGASDGTLTPEGQPRFVEGEYPSAATCLPQLSRSEDLELVFHRREVTTAVAGLLGTAEIFQHPNKWVRSMPPQPSDLYRPPGVHQDFPELQGSFAQMTMWAPLFPVTPDSGALPVYPAPDPRRVLPLELNTENDSGWSVDPTFLGAPVVAYFEPGDILVFNTLTPHGGARNIRGGWRVSIEARFQPFTEPICENQLVSFLGLDWDEHHQGWTRVRDAWRTRTPPTCAFDPTWERWRDAAAIAAGERGDVSARRALEIASDFAVTEGTRTNAERLLSIIEDDRGAR